MNETHVKESLLKMFLSSHPVHTQTLPIHQDQLKKVIFMKPILISQADRDLHLNSQTT